MMLESERAAEALRDAFPGREDAPLACALLGLLAEGRPVTAATLATGAGRSAEDVPAQLARWPNVERDADGAVVGFSGLTLRRTAHSFETAGRQLHTWCAWDTLFLPAILGATARVRSTCPISGRTVQLVVSPNCVERADPPDLHVSFPALATTNTADIAGTLCCHVHFLAGVAAGRAWQQAHPDGDVLDIRAAFDLGCRAVAPLIAAAGGEGCC